jgi:hypothetical protein
VCQSDGKSSGYLGYYGYLHLWSKVTLWRMCQNCYTVHFLTCVRKQESRLVKSPCCLCVHVPCSLNTGPCTSQKLNKMNSIFQQCLGLPPKWSLFLQVFRLKFCMLFSFTCVLHVPPIDLILQVYQVLKVLREVQVYLVSQVL